MNSCKKIFIENKLKEKDVEISILKEQEDVSPTPNINKEDLFAKIARSISSSNDTKIIIGGMLVSFVSLVLLICILAFFSL